MASTTSTIATTRIKNNKEIIIIIVFEKINILDVVRKLD